MREQTLLEQVIEAFRCLPGVGPKGAQRMLLYLLQRDREGGRHLARILSEAIDKIGYCRSCRNLTEAELCEICLDGERESNIICVVEAPSDVMAIEQSLSFRGQYFVLMGTLSPIEGRGPDEIGIEHLVRRCESGIEEIILAVSSTVEGEATAHYIAEALKPLNIRISRLAQGIPLGGELEYVDGGTLSHAFTGRKSI
ncbi:MAG: recombination mediator RecR [Candidatus Azotimanducaceae bacterium WSBS_2022_MAG_OTU7]